MNYRQEIMDFEPYNEQERTDKARMLEYIDVVQDILIRDSTAAHFTASAWIVNEDYTKTVMVYHNIYDSWAWTGGHVDGDRSRRRNRSEGFNACVGRNLWPGNTRSSRPYEKWATYPSALTLKRDILIAGVRIGCIND